MPGFDRRGPEGRGPMTGRRLGYCATDRQLQGTEAGDEETPQQAGAAGQPPVYGLGRGGLPMGGGRGRGFGAGAGRGDLPVGRGRGRRGRFF